MPRGYASLCCVLLVGLSGCSGGVLSTGEIQCVTPAQNAASPLVTPTYEGSGNMVEPTVIDFPSGWHGFRYWMVASPYPKSDAQFENPSILVSQDGTQWSVPPGLINPIALPTPGSALSDGSIVYDSDDDELWLYYLHDVPDAAGNNHEYLLRKTSKDGISWTPEVELLNGPNYSLTSPTVVKFQGLYYLWNVVVGALGCASPSTTITLRTSPDGVNWSAAQPVNLSIPNYVVWHFNVTLISRTNQLLIANTAYPVNTLSCGATSLFSGTSWDGITWNNPQPMLSRATPGSWDGLNIYRSSFLYDDAQSLLRIWYSADGDPGWHIGESQTSCTIATHNLTE